MNRISIRGVGIAVAAVTATSLAVGATTAAALPPTTASPVDATSTVNVQNLVDSRVGDATVPTAAIVGQLRRAQVTEAALARQRAAAALAAAKQVEAARKASAARTAVAKAAAAKAAAQKRAATKARTTRTYSRPVAPGSARALGKQLAASRGWTGAQWVCLDSMWTRESGWRVSAHNPSGAYGIPQAQPGGKMAGAGPNWRTSARTQILWGLGYIDSRYGTPCGAWHFWQNHHWY